MSDEAVNKMLNLKKKEIWLIFMISSEKISHVTEVLDIILV